MMNKSLLVKILLGLSLAAALLALALPPIPQDPAYHRFADTARLLGVPNFWNVVSNFPFIVIGFLGLRMDPLAPGKLPALETQYRMFFAGIFLTGLGSAYYHWNPDNQTLVWDRLPMTLSFMAFLCMIIGEHISVPASQQLFWPLIILGMASVGYWHKTELDGWGDLRLYGLVQFLPMLLIPLILLKAPSCFTSTRFLWLSIVAYGVAKILEYFDHRIYDAFGMGGHPLKHLAAAAGAWWIYQALLLRTRRGEAEPA